MGQRRTRIARPAARCRHKMRVCRQSRISDHIAITVNDLDATCTFYRRLFDARVLIEYESDGRIALRQIGFGTAVLAFTKQATV
jgi:Glyoxalase/Bleomycin resistance protein/Dioxygenase superfamily